jgi:ribosomal protein S18 acetylase RimI-like enzyme
METRSVGIAIAIPYVLFSEVYFFRSRRYFATISQRVVGLFAVEEEADTMFVSVLASNPFYRRMGVARLILEYTAALARRLGKTSLELAVTKRNKPAQNLYVKFGFHLKKEKARSYILRFSVR